jgi:hypothetical protein
MLPYQLALPAGWTVDPVSQGSGSDADELASARKTERLVVGHGYPKPGETVVDRVKANRTEETASGCASNSKQDRPIEVGGEHGILWSYSCAPDDQQLIPARDTYSLSAQTIYRRAGHRRVGYRFTVVVPLAKKEASKASPRPFAHRPHVPEQEYRHRRLIIPSPTDDMPAAPSPRPLR